MLCIPKSAISCGKQACGKNKSVNPVQIIGNHVGWLILSGLCHSELGSSEHRSHFSGFALQSSRLESLVLWGMQFH
jgi:hypothetical protein